MRKLLIAAVALGALSIFAREYPAIVRELKIMRM